MAEVNAIATLLVHNSVDDTGGELSLKLAHTHGDSASTLTSLGFLLFFQQLQWHMRSRQIAIQFAQSCKIKSNIAGFSQRTSLCPWSLNCYNAHLSSRDGISKEMMNYLLLLLLLVFLGIVSCAPRSLNSSKQLPFTDTVCKICLKNIPLVQHVLFIGCAPHAI